MRRLILFLLFLIASVWLGLEVLKHPGYVLVVVQPWMVEMPLWFALLGFVIFLFVFYLFLHSIDWIQFTWYRLKNWIKLRKEHQSYSKTQRGITALVEEEWKKSERLLMSGVIQSVEPLINYLGAAKAAHAQQAFDRQNDYLKKALHSAPHAELAIGITQAEFELDQDQLDACLATLLRLRKRSFHHPKILKLLEQVYIRSGDWTNLLALLPNLKKAKIINSEQMDLFEKNIFAHEILKTRFENLDELLSTWESMPKKTRKHPDVVLAYVNALSPFDNTVNERESLIRSTLKNEWHPDLVKIYGALPFENVNKQLITAGAWLKVYGEKPESLLTLGQLCVRAQLWGKARNYFEQCLNLGACPAASLEYGKLLESLNESEKAIEQYRRGLGAVL